MIKTLSHSEGKGTLGCMFWMALLAIFVFGGIKVIPLYYAAINFESDLKTEVSRAGSHFYEDEMIIKDILDLAKKDDVTVKAEDIKVQRAVGQIFVFVDWDVPVDFILLEHTLHFDAKTSSYIGRL